MLGPILFIIYINDLPEVVDKDTFIFLFADDTKIWRQVENSSDFEQLQKDLSNMVTWSNTWLLKFHPQKCISMRVGNQTDPPKFQYNMEGHPLNYSICEKDLGVHMDNRLNFDQHISNAINKVNRVMAVAKATFDYMDNEVFKQIFKGLVRPHVEYASSVWSPHLVKQKDVIEAVQRRATKWIPGFYDLPYNERLRKLKPASNDFAYFSQLFPKFNLIRCATSLQATTQMYNICQICVKCVIWKQIYEKGE